MKKLIVTATIVLFISVLIVSTGTMLVNGQESESIRDITIQEIKSSVETKCIKGYLFAIVIVQSDKGVSVDMEQIFEPGTAMFKQPPQPVECESK